MFKETSPLSAITILELMNQAKSVAKDSQRYVCQQRSMQLQEVAIIDTVRPDQPPATIGGG